MCRCFTKCSIRCLRVQPRWGLHCSVLCQLLMWYVTCTRCATHFCMALRMAIQQVGTPGQLKNAHFCHFITWISATSVLSVSPHALASHSSLFQMWSTLADYVVCMCPILYTALYHVVSDIYMSLLCTYIYYTYTSTIYMYLYAYLLSHVREGLTMMTGFAVA